MKLTIHHWLGALAIAVALLYARDTGITANIGSFIGFTGYPYSPAAFEFNILDTCGTIHSAYSYESGLVGYQTPVDDVDYLLCYQDWTLKGLTPSEAVRLPGHPWDHYLVVRWETIQGSGIALELMASNGGRFAFLHLRSIVNVKPGYWYPGGTFVAWSGWPTDPYFGNGTSGVSDAHLCLVQSQGSTLWFSYMDGGKDTQPYHFPYSTWNAYRVEHHESAIPVTLNSRWTWQATYWSSHHRYRWMHGIVNRGTWYGPQEGRNNGYTKTRFQADVLYQWPKLHASKAVKARWLR